MDSRLCIDHLVLRSNFNLLQNSQWITLPIKLCLVILFILLFNLISLIIRLSSVTPLLLLPFFIYIIYIFLYPLHSRSYIQLQICYRFSCPFSLLVITLLPNNNTIASESICMWTKAHIYNQFVCIYLTKVKTSFIFFSRYFL